MPQLFTCPHCAVTTNIADDFAGKVGPCAYCGREVEIPYFRPTLPRTSSRQSFLSRQVKQSIAAVVGVGLLVSLLVAGGMKALPVWRHSQAVRKQEFCAENLQRISEALRAYAEEHGNLPPSHAEDANQSPLYSWRVMILPYLGDEEKRLYQSLRLDESWQSPHNRNRLQQMPKVFASPADPDALKTNESSYHLVVGPKTAFPPGKTVKLDEIVNDPAATILVIEGRMRTNTLWCEPNDILMTPQLMRLGNGSTLQLGGNHTEGAQAIFFDNKVRVLPYDMSSQRVESLFDITGGAENQ